MKSPAGVESVTGSVVSGRFFSTLGFPIRVGRALGNDRELVIVISHRFWQRIFGGAADVIGRSLTAVDGGGCPCCCSPRPSR